VVANGDDDAGIAMLFGERITVAPHVASGDVIQKIRKTFERSAEIDANHVEIGYKRLAGIQEELLWLCEAAHVPVVWATQVLDQLVRKGMLSRAEITDAAMAERAECVMLNKGPFLVEAIGTLIDVLQRMQGHQSKKSARLRALHSWTNGQPR
jgi:Pyruvate kinase, barrel domain